MAIDSVNISNGTEYTPDGGLDFRRPSQPLRRLISETFAPPYPVEMPDAAMRFQDQPEIPWKQRRLATPSQTDWVWFFLSTFPPDLANSPPPRRLPPQKLQGGESSPPAVFEPDAVYLCAPWAVQNAYLPRSVARGRAQADFAPPWPPHATHIDWVGLFTQPPGPVRQQRHIQYPTDSDQPATQGITFDLGGLLGYAESGLVFASLASHRMRPYWTSGQPLIVTQPEELDWNVQYPGPLPQAWRPKRANPLAEGVSSHFVLLVATQTLSWWAQDQLPRWTRPLRQGSTDQPTLPDAGGDLAVSWALPTQVPKRLPPGPSRYQEACNWTSGLSFIVFGAEGGPNQANPFWVSAAGIYQAGAIAGKVL
jgi:hypothetical protein